MQAVEKGPACLIAGQAPTFDPRWEWIDVTPLGRPPGTEWIPGACRHLERHPVESIVTGEALAQLCGTCDAQLPPPPERTP